MEQNKTRPFSSLIRLYPYLHLILRTVDAWMRIYWVHFFVTFFISFAKIFEVADFNWSFLNCNVLRETHGLVADWYQRSPCNLKTIVGLRFRRSGTNIMPQYAAVWEEKGSKWKNKKQKTKPNVKVVFVVWFLTQLLVLKMKRVKNV